MGAVEHPRTVAFVKLWASYQSNMTAPTDLRNPDASLCLCYAGGTTKASRSAQVTHNLMLHPGLRGAPTWLNTVVDLLSK